MNLTEDGIQLNNLTNIQYDLLEDDSRFIINISGRRSRKTLIGFSIAMNRILRKAGYYVFAAPVRTQARGIFWNKLKSYLKGLDCVVINKMETYLCLTVVLPDGRGESFIQITGLDNPKSGIEGRPWNGIYVTELGDIPKEALGTNIMPILLDTGAWGLFDGVLDKLRPDYQDWIESIIGHPIANVTKNNPIHEKHYVGYKGNGDKWLFGWAYYHWSSEDVLSEDQIAALRAGMSEKEFEQEILALPVSMGATIYYSFSDDNIKEKAFDPNHPFTMCWDFNRTEKPMTTLIIQTYEEQGEQVDYVVKEFINKNHWTERQAIKVYEWLLNEGVRPQRIELAGDGTGKSLNSKSPKSDYVIISDSMPLFTFSMRLVRPNKRVENRYNAANARIKTASGKIRFYVTPNCPKTIMDFKKVYRGKDGREDQTNPNLSHATSAATYYLVNQYPLTNIRFH